MDVLIVVDVQRWFSPVPGTVTGAIVSEIRAAKRAKKPIVIVEMMDCQGTLSVLQRAIGKYSLVTFVTKEDWSGAKQIAKALESVRPNTLRICGLYTSRCLAVTSEALADEGFDVEVVAGACYDDVAEDHEDVIDYWRDSGFIRVL